MQLEIISRKEDVKPEALQTTRIFTQIGTALKEGYTVISEQGSSRSSKTYNTILFLIIYALIHKGLRISVVRATLPSLKASAFVDFKEILCKPNAGERYAIIFVRCGIAWKNCFPTMRTASTIIFPISHFGR